MPFLKKTGSYDIKYLENRLKEGTVKFFETDTSLMLVEVKNMTQYKVAHIMIGSGNFDGMVELLNSVEEWAKSYGCDRMQFYGRKGWMKYGKKYGKDWKVEKILAVKMLSVLTSISPN